MVLWFEILVNGISLEVFFIFNNPFKTTEITGDTAAHVYFKLPELLATLCNLNHSNCPWKLWKGAYYGAKKVLKNTISIGIGGKKKTLSCIPNNK